LIFVLILKAFTDFQNAKLSKLRSSFQEKLNELTKSQTGSETSNQHSNGFYRNTTQKIVGNGVYSNQSALNYLNARQRIIQKNQQQQHFLKRTLNWQCSVVE
jgi:hypothetical protein